MRLITLGILALGLAAGGCNGAEPSANGDALSKPSTTASTPDKSGATVATAGRAERGCSRLAAPAPVWREVTIPAGTSLPVVLDTGVGSETSRVEEPVTAHLSRSITVGGATVLAEGSRVSGVVTAATRAAKVKGRAHVAVRFDSVTPRGDDQRYDIRDGSGRTHGALPRRKRTR